MQISCADDEAAIAFEPVSFYSPVWFLLLAALGVAGCGVSSTPKVVPTPPVETSEASPVTPATPPRPVFDSTDLDQVARVYARVRAGDSRVFEAVGLTDAAGIPDPAKVARYYAAVKAAGKDEDRWKSFQRKVAQEARK